MPAHLSVSGPGLSRGCTEVVRAMRDLGVCGDVTPNISVVDGNYERGCRVVVASQPHARHAQDLWETLRTRHALTCAHVRIGDDPTSGCVLDVFRPSACPGKGGTPVAQKESV